MTDRPVRACPFCLHQLEEEANLCVSCGRFSSPFKVARPPWRLIEKVNELADASLGPQSKVAVTLEKLSYSNLRPPKLLLAAISALLIGYALVLLSNWIKPNGYWYNFRAALSLIITAVLVSRYEGLISRRQNISEGDSGMPRADVSVRILGYDLNLLLIQIVFLVLTIWFALKLDFENLYITGWLCMAFAFPLWGTSRRNMSIVFSSICAAFILGGWAIRTFNSSYVFANSIEQMRNMSDSLLSPKPYIITLIILAILPQLQIIRVGRLGLGRLKGDLHFDMLGSNVPISLTSAIATVSIISAIIAVFAAPAWVGSLFS